MSNPINQYLIEKFYIIWSVNMYRAKTELIKLNTVPGTHSDRSWPLASLVVLVTSSSSQAAKCSTSVVPQERPCPTFPTLLDQRAPSTLLSSQSVSEEIWSTWPRSARTSSQLLRTPDILRNTECSCQWLIRSSPMSLSQIKPESLV